MAAESIDYAPSPALLYEPEQPASLKGNGVIGWRRAGQGWVRLPGDDAFGARVQLAVARYYLADYRRADVARDLWMSERQAQTYLSGRAGGCYARPVLAALARLGITQHRGDWRAQAGRGRAAEIIRAQASVLDRCRALLGGEDFGPAALDELQADLRLLAFVTEGRP